MKGRTLTGLLFVLGFGLAIVLWVPERTVSRVIEKFGGFISEVLGL
jgi:hypothetical protein